MSQDSQDCQNLLTDSLLSADCSCDVGHATPCSSQRSERPSNYNAELNDDDFLNKFLSGKFGKKNIQDHFVYKHSLPKPSKKVVLSCKYCAKCLQSDSANNFERHILQKHPDKFLKPIPEKRPQDDLLPDFGRKKTKKVKLSDTAQTSYKMGIVDLICSAALPFNLVDSDGWRRFMGTVAPHINVQCRRTVVRDLGDIVNELKPKIKSLLSGIQEKTLHITLDVWSSRQRQSVLGIRCQYICNKWQMNNILVSFSHFPGKHSGEAIYAKILEELAEVGIEPSQVSCICADNAANITKALNMFEVFHEPWLIHEDDVDSQDSSENVVLDEAWGEMAARFGFTKLSEKSPDKHLIAENIDDLKDFEPIVRTTAWERKYCVAHTLQLAINDSIKTDEVAKPLLSRLQAWINFFRRSAKWTDELKSKTNGIDLKQAGGVRWSALFFALERFTRDNMLEGMLNAFSKARKDKVKIAFDLPTHEDVEDAKEVVELLRPLKTGTDFFQKSGIISSRVIGELITIFKKTYEVKSKKFAKLQSDLLRNLETRFYKTLDDPTYILASLLDPNIKFVLFDSEYTVPKWVEKYPKYKCPSRIRAETVFKEAVLKERVREPEINISGSSIPDEPYCPFSSLGLPIGTDAPRSPLNEIHLYKMEPRSNQPDVALSYWRTKEREFPILASLAKRYLAVPATSADVERLFSIAGFILRARRSSLSLKHVAQILIYREYKDINDK